MGLLDFLSTPDAQLGMGLLAAAGPRSDGAGFGQRLTEGVGYAQAQQDNALKRKMLTLQEQRAQASFDMQKDAYAGITGAGGGSTSLGIPASGGATSSASNGAMGGQPGGDTNAQLVRLEKMAIAGVPGAKEAFEIYKYRNDPQQLQPGTFSQNRVTGQREYIPDVKTGMGYGSNGMYALPGSGVIAGLEGDKQRAIEAAKAGLDLVDVPDGQGGTQKMPRVQAVQLLGGGQTRAAPAPAGYASEPQMRATSGGDMGADPQGAQREIARATADLKKTLDPSSRKQLTDYITELTRQAGSIPASAPTTQAPRWGASLTPDQQIAQEAAKVKAVDQVKADIQPTQAKQANIDSARNAYDIVNQALAHPGLSTATGLSGWVDPRNHIPGTDAKNFNVISDQLKGNAFLSAFAQLKGAGAITEVEGAKAEAAIARLDQKQSTDEYKKALKDYQSVIGQGLKRMGVDPSSEWGSPNNMSDKPKAPAPTPMKGMTRGGYKFKGGEPSDANNWEKM